MAFVIEKLNISDFARHHDLRVGFSLVNYKAVVNQFAHITKYPTTNLGKVIELNYGFGLTEQDRIPGKFPVVGSNGIVGYHDEFTVKGPTIVVGRKGSAGEVTYISESCNPIDTTFYVVQKSNNYDSKFLYYLLKALRLPKLALLKGVPGLNRYDAYRVIVPLLSKENQKHILDKIAPFEESINKLRSQHKDMLAVINEVFAEELKYDNKLWRAYGKGLTIGTQQSDIRLFNVYKAPLRQIGSNPMLRFSTRFHNPVGLALNDVFNSIPTIRLRTILRDRVQRGVQPINNPEGDIVVLKTGQLRNSSLDITNCEMVSQSFFDKYPKAQAKFRDVLLASSGKGSMGKADFMDLDTDAVVDGHISVLRLDEKAYNPEFLVYYLRSILGAFQIERDYTGATNQIELYSEQIESFLIPNLKLSVQKEIVLKIKTVLNAQRALKQEIKALELKITQLIEHELK